VDDLAGKAEKVVCVNRKARYDYEIMETVEAGMSLLGTEVKSLREGRANIQDGFAAIEDGEIFLHEAQITPYPKGTHTNHEPKRVRKLLLSKREIKNLAGTITEKGLTLIPLRIYFRGPWAKVELALARGKRSYDKRETIKRKTAQREMERAIKERR